MGFKYSWRFDCAQFVSIVCHQKNTSLWSNGFSGDKIIHLFLFEFLNIMQSINSIQLTERLGQQIWLDNLSRTLIASGALVQKIQEGVRGITTNPAIFLQSIQKDALYQADLVHLRATESNAKTRYETLAIADVQAACDVLGEVYRQSEGNSGFVSIEVDPSYANDIQQTLHEAQRLHRAIARENVMIKVPATEAGVEALQQLVAEGICVNMTLIFDLSTLDAIYRAYTQGLRRCQANGLPYQAVRVVASVFLSRVDTALDHRLPENRQGKTALSLAKTAYAQWQDYFRQPEVLPPQAQALSLLWASTGTKNKAYSDVLYVEEVIGAHTVNTIPEPTLDAFLNHGQVRETLTENVQAAAEHMAALAGQGIDFQAVAKDLQEQGLAQFCEAFSAILNTV